MNFDASLSTRQYFRFTGPPEHWLTAIKFMTWGLEEKYLNAWKEIKTGDVFFIHSTNAERSVFKNAKSGIIGIGVVGYHPSIKNNFLWHYEIKNKVNQWPLLVPLSEFYLFCELPDPKNWASPEPSNDDKTAGLIDLIIRNRVPLKEIKGFPQMGSFSKVSQDVAQQILFYNRTLYLYGGFSTRGEKFLEKKSNFMEVKNVDESMRYAASLRFRTEIKERLITKPFSIVERDNDILARAESSHRSIVQQLIEIFRSKGYDTYDNEFVDLFVHNGERSFLFEVKSTENKNFRTQARKAISQLFEYDYFDVNKFKEEKRVEFKKEYKILVPSREPKDANYIHFINSLDLGVALAEGGALRVIGKDLGHSYI